MDDFSVKIEELLSGAPYAKRNDVLFLRLANALTDFHRRGCPQYARIWPQGKQAEKISELPFLHAEIFKRLQLKTKNPRLKHTKMLKSSSTSGQASCVALDNYSSGLQRKSATLILEDFFGAGFRPLFILDNARSFREKGQVPAAVAAAMSLYSFASEVIFLLEKANEPLSINWEGLLDHSSGDKPLIIYGSTWILWSVWSAGLPSKVKTILAGNVVQFVHSGGWKKLEEKKVSRKDFNFLLLANAAKGSQVIDFYGLAEQVGVLFPLCPAGFRHLPPWADLVVRDTYSLKSLPAGKAGQLQLINLLAHGAPYHSVLTEDLGMLVKGNCPCGRKAKRFRLLGRIPQSVLRGCANV